MSRGRVSYSIIMELENGSTHDWSAAGINLRALAEEIRSLSSAGNQVKPGLILAHPGPPGDSDLVQHKVLSEAPELQAVARVQVVSVPQGRYYELKNAGIAQADGDVLVVIDSDIVPDSGWLSTLLFGFDKPDTVAVNGHTYLQHTGFVSRAFALFWVFPLREGDSRDARRRALNANNCAFRADWIKAHPFPIDNGFKVSCTKLTHQLRQGGADMARVPAYCAHLPLDGWRFLAWRALVTGRDADRKFADLRSPSRGRRFVHAFKYAFKMQTRALRRILLHHRHVAMPVWEVPAAVSLGLAFYGLAFCGQLARVLGLAGDRVEGLPAFAEHH